MPYLMTDDGFPDHEKVDALSDGAFRLHVAGMHYCASKLTDGAIPTYRVDRLKPAYKPSQLNELLRGRLWHKGGEGCGSETCPIGEAGTYVVHDYLEWNKPASWWEDRRKAEAERKADYRRKRAEEKARLAELEAMHERGLRSV
jgi:hypothetical protein